MSTKVANMVRQATGQTADLAMQIKKDQTAASSSYKSQEPTKNIITAEKKDIMLKIVSQTQKENPKMKKPSRKQNILIIKKTK